MALMNVSSCVPSHMKKVWFCVSYGDFRELLRVTAPEEWAQNYAVNECESQTVWLDDGPYAVYAAACLDDGKPTMCCLDRDTPNPTI